MTRSIAVAVIAILAVCAALALLAADAKFSVPEARTQTTDGREGMEARGPEGHANELDARVGRQPGYSAPRVTNPDQGKK